MVMVLETEGYAAHTLLNLFVSVGVGVRVCGSSGIVRPQKLCS
jgi:hypothetical protein